MPKIMIAAMAVIATSIGSFVAEAGSFVTWEGYGGRAWSVDSDFRVDSIGPSTYLSTGSWNWYDKNKTEFHAYFGIQADPDVTNGNAIFSVFGPVDQIEGIKAANNGASGTESCNIGAKGTIAGSAEGENVSCVVRGFPWKLGTWYTARIWAHGLRTQNGIEQERWGYWILEKDAQSKIVNERWVADFWVPRSWGYIPVTDWGGFVETFASLNGGGCCYRQKVVGACGQLASAGSYYFAPPVPNQDATLALNAKVSGGSIPSGCAPAIEITSFGDKQGVQLVRHGMLNQSVFDASPDEFEDCSRYATLTPQLPVCNIK